MKISKTMKNTRWSAAAKAAAVLSFSFVVADAAEVVEPSFYIREYRVTGSTKLSELERGEAVYPFLGPGRTTADIESARMALEKAYKAKGYETVAVEVPVNFPRSGVVHLRVVEMVVGRVRVEGARYFLPSQIMKSAPSLKPGTVPNFQAVQREMLALNQWPDRSVSPSIKAGAEPGTVDVDLKVEDKNPLHASVELNNRYSQFTSQLRLNSSVTYNNLWQRGHSVSFSAQMSPQEWSEVQVFSGSYTARFLDWPGFSLVLQGTKQNSNVSTLGGSAVVGRGETIGARAIFNLPPADGFYHSLSAGVDYKRYNQTTFLGELPLEYYPVNIGYSAGWAGEKAQTELTAGVTFGLRGTGFSDEEFDQNRFKARSNFFYFRGDLAHTHELPGGAQLYAKVQGQASSQPLVSNEQFAAGGVGTVRGYLEAEALGDSGILGSVELRSPSLLGTKRKDSEWRFYAFVEGGMLVLREALPEQDSRFELASIGLGTNVQIFEYFTGSLDIGFPLTSLTATQAGDSRLSFKVSAEF